MALTDMVFGRIGIDSAQPGLSLSSCDYKDYMWAERVGWREGVWSDKLVNGQSDLWKNGLANWHSKEIIWFGQLPCEQLDGEWVNGVGGRFSELVDGWACEWARVDEQNTFSLPPDRTSRTESCAQNLLMILAWTPQNRTSLPFKTDEHAGRWADMLVNKM